MKVRNIQYFDQSHTDSEWEDEDLHLTPPDTNSGALLTMPCW